MREDIVRRLLAACESRLRQLDSAFVLTRSEITEAELLRDVLDSAHHWDSWESEQALASRQPAPSKGG